MRQIVLDTETTGLRVEEGHRIIEIGCIELVDRRITSKHFHYYFNPQREVEAGAFAVHGISNEFLKDKPLFSHMLPAFVEFVKGAELIIHNAPFDLSFLDEEFKLTKQNFPLITEICTVVDTLKLARQLHPGQRNTLDALCKRYSVDASDRQLHGALLDANLLARVYLAMTGGQGSLFDVLEGDASAMASGVGSALPSQKYHLKVLLATPEEQEAHQIYMKTLQGAK